ncbi:MAG: hypothetical protein CMN55_14055 [Sneathiella sp.]|jgi:threonine/homoserine/homoserine lactone efflux protein|uniref:LysE family translocator n=1 Tax=Sneathiella sp. TaxID=1964365 RepID=UPI000C6A9AC7|nr:LysE family translocator [Sneathiella sp.]MAL80206.1 hypothetical protein [Sneathiella sp.]
MESILALILVTLGLVAIPGPNVALTVANSLRYGAMYGLVTVLGTTAGVGLQLVLVVLGIGALLELAADILTWIKWAGVAYLLWLGIRSWLTPAADLAHIGPVRAPIGKLFLHGLGIAVLNPKTLIFNAALLPQFITPGGNHDSQLALIAAVFLIVLTLGDSLWAFFAGALRPLLLRYGRWRNRLTGGFLIAAGIGLALSGRK